MPPTPRRKSNEALQPPTPKSQKKRLDKGLWKDGEWWCNCEPRKKATLRETKKSGRNAGKLFWTCNVYPFCDFFLWRDLAKARETGLAPRPEEDAEAARPAFTQKPLTAFGYQITPGRRGSDVNADAAPDLTDSDEELDASQPEPATAIDTAMETPCAGSSKRKRDAFEDDEFSDLSSDEERQLVAIADKSAEKATAKRVLFTPSTTRTHDIVNGLATPSVARTLFPGSEAKRQKQVSFSDAPSAATPSSHTISPGLSITPLAPSSSPADTTYDVASEVLALLRGQKVDSAVLKSVEAVLATAARRTEGLERGRDAVRMSLKARDEKIAALQERIAALENRAKMDNIRRADLKANLMKMYEDN
ncbi:hypothetical protein G7046_g17 [Stylonectria norvegica]|nr:hypothetical protein G7046_g17 [Stylonectria norvegica]